MEDGHGRNYAFVATTFIKRSGRLILFDFDNFVGLSFVVESFRRIFVFTAVEY